MKISKREKFLLGLLVSIFITVVYYQFIFKLQVQKINERKIERDKKLAEFNEAINTINNLDMTRLNFKVLNSNILDKSKSFYPVILQEKIILELDKLLQGSGVKGNISFSPIEVSPVEQFIATKVTKKESSLKSIVDEYNGLTKSQSTAEDEKAEHSSDITTEQLKIAINFTSSYGGLKKFLDLVNGSSRDIAITNISISPTSSSDISGTMNLEFYAVPKIGDEDMEYLKWTLDNTYGKDTPFSDEAASGAYNSTVEQLSVDSDVNDFVIMVRATSSELPTLTMGKAKDSLRETYLYSDKPKVQDVQIQFFEEGGLLYYKYNTSDSFYPKTNTKLGKEFKPFSNDIVVEISSESRLGSSDNSGINLKVLNNTTKTVNIIIKNDDNTNPRVSVLSEGNTVNVTKK
jgi:type IV pilus assembly protein PilO